MSKNINMTSVFKYMFVEFIIGCMIGLIIMQSARMNAQADARVRVIPTEEYTSSYFRKNFPRHAFDAFLLPPEFVILKSERNIVVNESFYTFLGTSITVDYENGRYKPHGFSALTSPVYLCTVLIPIIIGFFPSLIPGLTKYFSPLLFSGVVWMFLTFSLQIIIGTITSAANSR